MTIIAYNQSFIANIGTIRVIELCLLCQREIFIKTISILDFYKTKNLPIFQYSFI